MSSGEPTDELEFTLQSLGVYFSKVAELLFQCGACPSKEEAKRVINANPDVLQHEVGPDGIVLDDGLLDSDKLAEGIIALTDANEYWFQAPIAVCNDDFFRAGAER